jgi:hypothetical protein
MCIFLEQKKYGIWGDFSEKFQVLCKNPDEVTRFDGITITTLEFKIWTMNIFQLGRFRIFFKNLQKFENCKSYILLIS